MENREDVQNLFKTYFGKLKTDDKLANVDFINYLQQMIINEVLGGLFIKRPVYDYLWGFESEILGQPFFGGVRNAQLFRRIPEQSVPKLVPWINGLHAAKQAAHAVADEDHVFRPRVVVVGVEVIQNLTQ